MNIAFTRSLDVLKYILMVLLLVTLTACANLQAYKAPGADFNKIQSIYVTNKNGDDSNIDRIIAEQLCKMGYKATYGSTLKTSDVVDALVSYEDKWMWDMTMYLLKLNINVLDGTTSQFIAKGESYRPSLQRKSPEGMVEEVLQEIFKK